MNRSESIKNIAIALSKFQSEIKNPTNTKLNPYFKNTYAPLEEVLNTVKPILTKYGLSVIQMPISEVESGSIGVVTTLLHESGEYLESSPFLLRADKNTAQGAGSAITYARRYSLSAMLGIASEDDDDANFAEINNKKNKKNASNGLASSNQIDFLVNLAKTKNITGKMPGMIKEMFSKNSSQELTKSEADKLIKKLQAM